jgi:hypothetical protein
VLKNTSTKHNKYAVKQKLQHFGDITFRELFWQNQGGFFFNFCLFVYLFAVVFLYAKYDLSLPKTKYLYLCWPFFS